MLTSTTPGLHLDRSLLRPGNRVCVALSGGADSVALLLALIEGNAAPRAALGRGIAATQPPPGRGGVAADADAAFVHNLCTRLEIPLQLHHVDVPARVSATGESIEEAARELRYDAFAGLLARREADAVLTAHTVEDQAETVLMKLLRGAWTAGLSGIYPVLDLPGPVGALPGRILRPLLQTHRSEIEIFLRDRAQPWREDSTNADLAFTRNRLRQQVLPLLRTFNPSLDQNLAQLAELAREEEARWAAELSRILPHLLLPGQPVRGGGRAVSTTPAALSVSLEVERLRPLDPALRRRVLRAAAQGLGSSLTFDETWRLLALCGFAEHPNVSARSGATLELSGRLRASRSPRELRLSREAPGPIEVHGIAR